MIEIMVAVMKYTNAEVWDSDVSQLYLHQFDVKPFFLLSARNC